MKNGFLIESIRLLGRSLKSAIEGVYGLWRFSYLQDPIVSILGGGNVKQGSEYGNKAQELSRMLVENNLSVITGGGPGIMEAANCGAQEGGATGKQLRTLGIMVRGIDPGFTNSCAQTFRVSYLSQRKWFLIHYSCGFVFFPGGIGTMDELFHLLDLMKLNRIPQAPVILIGTAYWAKIREWYVDFAIREGLVPAQFEDLFMITDDLREVIDILKKASQK
jgi:uncharacterized protein (TIGR00730 family)